MVHANLDSLEAVLDESSMRKAGRGPSVWFETIENGCARFVCDVSPDADPTVVAAACALSVAQAWRAHRSIRHRDDLEEVRLASLTAVYLGFGVVFANGSFPTRSESDADGQWVLSWWQHKRAGYLSPQLLAHCLALQSASRQQDRAENRRVETALVGNLREYYDVALQLQPSRWSPVSMMRRTDLGLNVLEATGSPGGADAGHHAQPARGTKIGLTKAGLLVVAAALIPITTAVADSLFAGIVAGAAAALAALLLGPRAR
jgi:hypothetical protein